MSKETQNVKSDTSPRSNFRQVTGFTATCILVSNVIGTGIFTTTGFMARDVGNPWQILLLWVVGALLALTGAICYSELGAAFPLAGGEYIYLRHAFSPFIGFLSGWASLTVGFGAAVAAGAVGFASYVLQVVPVANEPEVLAKGLALGLVWALTAVHVAGVGTGSLIQQALTVLKVGSILILVVCALLFGNGKWENLHVSVAQTTPGFGTFIVSLIFVIYAYSGWNAAGYIAGEIIHPERNIPRTMIVGTLLVGGIYLILNLMYFYALPTSTLAKPPLLPVAEKASVALFGPPAADVVAVMLSISIAGTVSAMIWAGPRIYYAMARDGVFPALFSETSGKGQVPIKSIMLQSTWVTLLILSGTFEQLVVYSGLIITLFTGLAVSAVLVLRWRQPQLFRPYGVPFYPILPCVYVAASLVIVCYTFIERPMESFLSIVTVFAGSPFYFYWAKTSNLNRPMP